MRGGARGHNFGASNHVSVGFTATLKLLTMATDRASDNKKIVFWSIVSLPEIQEYARTYLAHIHTS